MSNIFYTIAQKAIATIKPYTPGRPIEEIRKKYGLRAIIKLASNELPFPVSSSVRNAVWKELRNVHRYPYSGCPALSAAVARQLKVSADQLVFGNGSDELITLCVKSFITGAADEVVVAHPTFLIYSLQSTLAGARVVTVPMKEYAYDLDAMAAAISPRTKIVFIANPDNPTGSFVSDAALRRFFKNLPEKTVLFIDEAYYEFAAFDKKEYPDTVALLKNRKNIIVTRTFSKAYGLAGLRLGYAVTSPEIAEIFNKVREPFNVNRLAEAAAVAAFKEGARVKKQVRFIIGQKQWVQKQLVALRLSVVPSATNFLLVLYPQSEAFVEYAVRKGVIVRSMSGWGIPHAFRVTVGTHAENARFIAVLQQFLRERGNGQ